MTNKVKFKLKITGFELEIEGTKENAAMITGQVSDTLRGLMNPYILNGDEQKNNNGNVNNHTEDADATVLSDSIGPSKRRSPRKGKPQNNSNKEKAVALDFKHDPEKYGIPLQEWSTSKKSLWLLYVVKQILKIDELSSNQIKETFNKHFKQSKMIQNVARDLGVLKKNPEHLVAEDTSKNPSAWYLTEAGEKHVQKLIAEQKTKGNGIG